MSWMCSLLIFAFKWFISLSWMWTLYITIYSTLLMFVNSLINMQLYSFNHLFRDPIRAAVLWPKICMLTPGHWGVATLEQPRGSDGPRVTMVSNGHHIQYHAKFKVFYRLLVTVVTPGWVYCNTAYPGVTTVTNGYHIMPHLTIPWSFTTLYH